jgi:prepilin peptidase CpaA
MVTFGGWIPAMVLALIAGWTDWRTRRIPNWLTVSGVVAGVTVNSLLHGWTGTKSALLGLLLGLGLLLPFVLIRSLGAGDMKLVGAVGACFGSQKLISVLIAAVFVEGLMALALVIYKRRLVQTLRNMWQIIGSFLHLRLPGAAYSIDNPDAIKTPYGVAVAIAVVGYGLGEAFGKF